MTPRERVDRESPSPSATAAGPASLRWRLGASLFAILFAIFGFFAVYPRFGAGTALMLDMIPPFVIAAGFGMRAGIFAALLFPAIQWALVWLSVPGAVVALASEPSTYIGHGGVVVLAALIGRLRDMRWMLHEESLRAKAALAGEKRSEDRYRTLFVSSSDAIMILSSPSWSIVSANPATLVMFGATEEAELLSRVPWQWSPTRQPDGALSVDKARALQSQLEREGSVRFEWSHRRLDGTEFVGAVQLTSMTLGDQPALLATTRDITEQRAVEVQLAHARKLEAVGQLASGIAHEINTPVQFVGDSISFVEEGVSDLVPLIRRYREAVAELGARPDGESLAAQIGEAEDDADLDYLLEQLPLAFERSQEGVARIAGIVRAMKEFAHPDSSTQAPADLNHALENALTMSQSEHKHVAVVELDVEELPPVTCYIGDLNQVFLNLIVNASHAISDVLHGEEERGRIVVRTRAEGARVRIEFEDSGPGIPPEIRDRIFEPFFTTKEVGKGSGQGLAIARSVVVEKHGGELSFDCGEGEGTTFTIRLPVGGRGSSPAPDPQATSG